MPECIKNSTFNFTNSRSLFGRGLLHVSHEIILVRGKQVKCLPLLHVLYLNVCVACMYCLFSVFILQLLIHTDFTQS